MRIEFESKLGLSKHIYGAEFEMQRWILDRTVEFIRNVEQKNINHFCGTRPVCWCRGVRKRVFDLCADGVEVSL